MKKFIVLFAMLVGLAECKKSNDKEEVTPEPTGLITASEFLKALDVTGAEAVRFDSANNSYIVNLPDGYTLDKAEVLLTLQPNILLEADSERPGSGSVINYDYRGTKPLSVRLRRKSGNRVFSFQVYFRFSGMPEIELLEKQIQVHQFYTQLDLRYRKNVGSIPASPQPSRAVVRITNKKTGKAIKASFDDQFAVMIMEGDWNLITGDLTNVEVTLNGQKPVTFDGVRFAAPSAMVYPAPSSKYQFLYADTIKIYRENLVPGRKYWARFSNDFLASPTAAPAKIVDGNWLEVDHIPAELPEGSYLLSFFEAEKLIGHTSFHVSSHETNGIESIWKGNLYGATTREVSALSVRRGESFFVKSSPLIYGYGNSSIDAAKLPRLRLRSGQATIELNPELVVFGWAIAGITLGVGKFTIPATLPPGNYDVHGLFVNNSESKPYWSKLQVK